MAKKLFKEKQQLRYSLFSGLCLFFIVLLSKKVVEDFISGASMGQQLISLLLILILGFSVWFLGQLKLETAVSKKGISFRMFPWQKRKVRIYWENVKSVELVQTPVVSQWHGGNIAFNGEKRFSLTGRNGVHITTNNGHSYFIGTQRLEDMASAIRNVYGQHNGLAEEQGTFK